MSDEINIHGYLRIIKKHWKIWVIIFLIVEIITLIRSVKQEKTYEATATILPPEIATGELNPSEFMFGGGLPVGLFGGGTASQAIIAMLKSRRMAEHVAERFNLKDVYKTNTNMAAAEVVRANIRISLSKDYIIIVKVESADPKLAAGIANFYVTNLDSINEELKVSSVKPVATLLDSALPPTAPSKPTVGLNLFISGVLALLIGILLSFLLEYFITTEKQLKTKTT